MTVACGIAVVRRFGGRDGAEEREISRPAGGGAGLTHFRKALLAELTAAGWVGGAIGILRLREIVLQTISLRSG